MNNQDLIDKCPQQDDIDGWNLQRYKKNLRKKLKDINKPDIEGENGETN
jgi:hypothetical protein